MNSSSQLKWRRHQLWSNATIKTKTTESMSDTRIKEEKKNPATTDRSSKSVSNDECWRQPRSSRTATSYAHIQRTMKKFRTRLMKTEKENGERKQNKETHQRNESSQRASEIERERERADDEQECELKKANEAALCIETDTNGTNGWRVWATNAKKGLD